MHPNTYVLTHCVQRRATKLVQEVEDKLSGEAEGTEGVWPGEGGSEGRPHCSTTA